MTIPEARVPAENYLMQRQEDLLRQAGSGDPALQRRHRGIKVQSLLETYAQVTIPMAIHELSAGDSESTIKILTRDFRDYSSTLPTTSDPATRQLLLQRRVEALSALDGLDPEQAARLREELAK